MRFFGQYLEDLPVPRAGAEECEAIAKLAQNTQTLHTQRRQCVEKLMLALGVSASESNSRNPLEQPWTLSPDEFIKRTKKLSQRAQESPMRLYEAARDETADLTERIAKLEREIDERVAALYGVPLDANAAPLIA